MARRAKPWYRSNEDTWYATHDGKQVSLGIRGLGNESAAWRAWERLRAGAGADPVAEAREFLRRPIEAPPAEPRPRSVTVRELFDAFFNRAPGWAEPITVAGYHSYLDGFAALHAGRPAESVTRGDAESYCYNRPVWKAPATRAMFVRLLKTAFNFGVREGLVPRSPIDSLKIPAKGPGRAADVALTRGEHERLVAHALPLFRPFMEFMFLTGCRPNEAARLTASDVNWETGTAVLRKHKTDRHGGNRILYLVPEAVAVLRPLAALHPTGPLFRNSRGNIWHHTVIGTRMRRASEKAGLPWKCAYGYRHGFATDALVGGVPDAHVAELLGHKGTVMLHRHYSHLVSHTRVLADAAAKVRKG